MDSERFFKEISAKVLECGRHSLDIQEGIRSLEKDEDPENQAASALTEADIKVQEELLRYFLDQGYDFKIFAEEDTRYVDEFPEEGDTLVSLDPVDGTLAYKNNLPNFCTVLAVYEKGCLDGVMVHTPAFGKFYCATQDVENSWVWTPTESGEFLREDFVYVPKCDKVVLTYNPKKIDPEGKQAEKLDQLRESGFEVHEIDKKGKMDPNIGINSILRGEISAYFRSNVPCLDWGPISLIMEKAGGVVSDYQGRNPDLHRYWGRTDGAKDSRLQSIIVSGNSTIHNTLVDILR
ncbi:inositol monophosphatase family protein [Nanoarchaeota archaeon]